MKILGDWNVQLVYFVLYNRKFIFPLLLLLIFLLLWVSVRVCVKNFSRCKHVIRVFLLFRMNIGKSRDFFVVDIVFVVVLQFILRVLLKPNFVRIGVWHVGKFLSHAISVRSVLMVYSSKNEPAKLDVLLNPPIQRNAWVAFNPNYVENEELFNCWLGYDNNIMTCQSICLIFYFIPERPQRPTKNSLYI